MDSTHLSWCSCLSCHLNIQPYFFRIQRVGDQDSLIFCVYQESLQYISALVVSMDLTKRNFIQLSLIDAQRGGITENQVRRAIFEASIVQHLPQTNPLPTCFICFNVFEKDVGDFLRKDLVPDLEMAGFKTHFCFRDLNLGDDLYKFMEHAYEDDMVIIVCTPAFQQKVKDRVIGVTYEVERLIIPRFERTGVDKHNVFPICYSGSRLQSCPAPGLMGLFQLKLFADGDANWRNHYFAHAFNLFTSMKKMNREEANAVVEAWKGKKTEEGYRQALIHLEKIKKSKNQGDRVVIKEPEEIDKIVEKYEKNCGNSLGKPLNLSGTQGKIVNLRLQNAEKKRLELEQLLGVYLNNMIAFEDIQQKLEEAIKLYTQIQDRCDEKAKLEVSAHMNFLNLELKKVLFSHALNQCVGVSAKKESVIEEIETIIYDEKDTAALVATLKELFSDNWKEINGSFEGADYLSLKKSIKPTTEIEASLFAIAVLHELLGEREKAIEGYFGLSDYHQRALEHKQRIDRPVLIKSCLSKAQSLETMEEKKYKEDRVHQEFVGFLQKMRQYSDYDPFSCFISYEDSEETKKWIEKFLYRDLITLGIRPFYRKYSEISGGQPVDYAKEIRKADFSLILCTPEMKGKYEDYLRGITTHANLGMEMKFLGDRFISGKDLGNTFLVQTQGDWEDFTHTQLPDFFIWTNLLDFSQQIAAPYSKNRKYFEECIRLFCSCLNIPENVKVNYLNEFTKIANQIENHPCREADQAKVKEFLKSLETIPPLPLLADKMANRTRLIGIPNMGKYFQTRTKISLESLFKHSDRIVLTQDPSIICGVGKSYVAYEYVNRVGSKYDHVFWIDSTDQVILQKSLSKVAEALNKQWSDATFFVQWLKDNPTTTLVIFDHVSHPDTIAHYLPDLSPKCHILVTSRHTEWPKEWTKTSLGLFSLDEGTELIANITGKSIDGAAKALANSLDNIPSLIEEAGLYLKDAHNGAQSYKTIMGSKKHVNLRTLAQRGKSFLASRIEHFSGRKSYIAALQEIIFSNPSSLIVLQGPRYIGKTSIAHEFAFKNATKFESLWNLPCSQEQLLKATVFELATTLDVSTQEDDLRVWLKQIYEKLKMQKKKTLLVFDDLSANQIDFLPSPSEQLHVIVTTEINDWQDKGHCLLVSEFTKQEAETFLKETLEKETLEKDRLDEKIVLFLGQNCDVFKGSPLALSFAAHYLNASKKAPPAYLESLSKKLENNANCDTLFSALWYFTEEALLEKDDKIQWQQLLPLAKLCACYPEGLMTKQYLLTWLTEQLKDAKLNPLIDPIHKVLDDLLTRLRKYFIVDRTDDTILMHSIIAEAIKSKMTQEELLLYSKFS